MLNVWIFLFTGFIHTTVCQIRAGSTSCFNRCQEKYIPNLHCYCNEACSQYENCCLDYIPLCNPELAKKDTWISYNGHKYKYTHDSTSTALTAKQYCAESGALLVSFNNKEEYYFIEEEVLRWRTLSAFIGGSDIIEEGKWVWADGTTMPLAGGDGWQSWYEGQPDNAKDVEHCSIMTNYYKYWIERKLILKNYTWFDYMCNFNAVNEIQGYICEGTLMCDPNPCQNGGSCIYIGQQPEFECRCLDNFVGDYCQYEIIPGEIWTICGETNLTQNKGVISSPLYPKQYPPNIRCTWYITTDEGSTISIRIQDADIEPSKHCFFDALTIYDDQVTNNNTVLFGPFCGGPLSGLTYTTSSNKAVVTFTTDQDQGQRGFKLSYSHHTCGEGTGNSGCATKKLFKSQCGQINLIGATGIVTEQCDWIIQVNPSKRINITFTMFHLQDTGQTCTSGLEVYDELDNNMTLIATYCGHRAPFSIYSKTNTIYMRLTNSSLLTQGTGFNLQYQSYDATDFEVLRNNFTVTGMEGGFMLTDTHVYIKSSMEVEYKWHVKVPYGSYLNLTWMLQSNNIVHFKVYKGLSEQSVPEVLSNVSTNGSITIPYFQAVVYLRLESHVTPQFVGTFKSQEWSTDLSHCYRPYFYDTTHSPTTENIRISQLEPVMLKITENNGYPDGMYCKWLIQGGYKLVLDIIDVDIYPTTEDCGYDGLAIYNGPTTEYPLLGPFCGSSSLKGKYLQTENNQLLVVFYSEPNFGQRSSGQLRALIKEEHNECPVWNMQGPTSLSYSASCGMIMSPNFPGTVQQGLWFWTYTPPKNHYISLDVYYVRGPGMKDPECGQSLKVIEIPKDSTSLRQNENDLITLCGETELFIPPALVKLPPDQKMGIELNTIVNPLPQIWQFKMSFAVHEMEKPKEYPIIGTCPQHYIQWRNHCYRYHAWVERHYRDTFNWQQTWQLSLEQCQSENATLLSVLDEEEAYFLKYTMSNYWYWDSITPYSLNHRLIYLGLKMENGNYEWTNGVKLSYADWYKPSPAWMQDILYKDSTLTEIFNTKLPQPSASVGSLCSGMLPLSPFGSLNWIKIPCDYPLFRAGAICKRPIIKYDNETNPPVVHLTSNSYTLCPERYFYINDRCYTMITVYADHVDKTGVVPLNIDEAINLCHDNTSVLPDTTDIKETLWKYLNIWNHTVVYGDILIARNYLDICFVVKALSVNNERKYEEMTFNCSDFDKMDITLANVICSTIPSNMSEECGIHEFRCDNTACISVDGVCDSIKDCTDGSDENNCVCDETTFQCINGHCISLSLRCDDIDNCGDMSDELDCVSKVCGDGEFKCTNKQCIPYSRVCNLEYDCSDNSDESHSLCGGKCKGFQCFSGTCLNTRLIKDGISDCPGLLYEDEIFRENDLLTTSHVSIKALEITNLSLTCAEGGQSVKCRQDENKCYDRSKACVLDRLLLDETNPLQVQAACRDGYNIRKHCEHIECPDMYHCPGSYCIPIRQVCDGVVDCPMGQDEENCTNYNCPGYFKCKSSSVCIPHSEVCDGINNCGTYKEDEKYCGEMDPICDLCNCQGFIAFCQDRGIGDLPIVENTTRALRAIFLDSNRLYLTDTTFNGLHWLNKLKIGHNYLNQLPVGVFRKLLNLQYLDLSYNLLTVLKPGTLSGLSKLKTLNLSHNRLQVIYKDSFNGVPSLQNLLIENNPSDLETHQFAFAQLHQLQILNSDAYKFCCIAKQVEVCTPAADEFSNCEDLMANYTLQIAIWVLGIMATVGNLFVIVWRIVTDKGKVSSMFIINLGCSDFLMGVYLLIIAAVDLYYRGIYIVHADSWKSSTLCQIVGILAMFSSELSVYMLTAITLDRCLAIMFPFKFGNFRMKHARFVVATGWILCLFLSLLPLTKSAYFGDAFFGRSGVCLPFQITSEKLPGWEYSVFIFLVLNFISFISIFVCYTAMFVSVKASIKSMAKTATSTADDYSLAKKLVIIVATDFCCWVPIILIGFASLGGATIPPQVSAWIAVFILPMNSALNPLLYTISAIDCSKKKKKRKKSSYYSSSTRYSIKDNTCISTISTSNDVSNGPIPDKVVLNFNTDGQSTKL